MKVVEIFEIPMAPKEKLNKIFFDELNLILFNYIEDESEFDEDRLFKVFWSIINPCLGSIRDIKRLINCFHMKLNLGFKELDWIDLLALTVLQVFSSKIYHWIFVNKGDLTGGVNSFEGIIRSDQEKIKTQQLSEFESILPGKAEYMLECVTILFPRYAKKVIYDYENIDSDSLRVKHRIASDDRFTYYFNLSIDEIIVSSDVLKHIVNTADKEQIQEYYETIIKEDNFIEFLLNLRGIEDSVSKERKLVIAESLFSTLGKSSEKHSKGLFVNTADDQIISCITKLLVGLVILMIAIGF